MVKPFTSYPGIKSVVSGYSGGHVEIQHTNRYAQIKQDMWKLYKLNMTLILQHLKIS